MPDVSFLPAEWQAPVAVLFAVSMVLFAAWARVFGKKEGPPAPKVQEFAMSGQLADMGPVKELVESVGLLVHQQVRTNMAIEANTKAITHIAGVFESNMEAERRDREISDEVRRQLKDRP